MRARIRDFFVTLDNWAFAVADYHHADGVRSMLRYVPDPSGERIANGIKYRKLDFDDAFAFLRRIRPNYVRDLHVVPIEDIKQLYTPVEGLGRVMERDQRVNRIATVLADDGIPLREMGITGSMLLDLHSQSSDIDFVVYGPLWWRARDALSQAKSDGRIQDLDAAMWRRIYAKRKPEISFEEFVLHEKRKGNRGMIDGTYFDLLFTRDWDQIGPAPERGRTLGKRKIVAEVIDTEFAFDSPAIFKLEHSEINEIFCYSHTYAGQALPGETIEASGIVEETQSGCRLVVGTTREAKGEWIRSLTLLESGR
ncbi:MAG: nucleotidyltransferase domain-containing protein [Methanotrichaceae archaeon]